MFRRLALSLAWLISLLALTAVLVWAEASKPEGAAFVPSQIGVAGVPYQALDWDCLSHAGPPVSQAYTLLVLSNDYLSVTLLPELGRSHLKSSVSLWRWPSASRIWPRQPW